MGAADVVARRVAALDTRHADVSRERYGVTDRRKVTPRLVLIHTFAHALIEQMASTVAIRLRHCESGSTATGDMAGLLIYTATSDAAGSLGGIVAQGRPENLDDLVQGAIARISWCSADPVCIETPFTGADGLNRAACHACVLLAETSCEEMNVLLDRALLVGTRDQPELGLLPSVGGLSLAVMLPARFWAPHDSAAERFMFTRLAHGPRLLDCLHSVGLTRHATQALGGGGLYRHYSRGRICPRSEGRCGQTDRARVVDQREEAQAEPFRSGRGGGGCPLRGSRHARPGGAQQRRRVRGRIP